MERLAPVIQDTTGGLIHQPEGGEGARIIAALSLLGCADEIE
jgi:hypothetical protein